MLAKMIDKIVSLKETKTFEIGGQTYTDGHLAVLLVVLIVVLVKEGVKQTEERQRRELRSENIDEQARRYGLERQPGESDLELKKRLAFFKQAERRAGRR